MTDRHRSWLLGVLALAAVLRLTLLTDNSVWNDEAYRITRAKGYALARSWHVRADELGIRQPPRPLRRVLQVAAATQPPLLPVALNLWMRAGADGDRWLRLPFALCGVLAVLGTWLLGCELYDRRAALLAAIAVALSGYHVYYAQEINFYAPAACLVAFSYACYYRLLRRPTLGAGLGFVVTATAALYTHYYCGLVLACQALGVILYIGWQPARLLRAGSPVVLAAALFALYLPVLGEQVGGLVAGTPDTFGDPGYFAERARASAGLPWLGGLAERSALALAAGILGWLLFAMGLQELPDRRLRLVVVLNAIGPLFLIACTYTLTQRALLLWPRYQLFFSFALYVPAAAAVVAGGRGRWLRYAAGVVMGFFLAWGLLHHYRNVEQIDWRRAAQLIARDGRADDVVLVRYANLYSLGHYLEGGQRLYVIGHEGWRAAIDVEAASAGGGAAWTAFPRGGGPRGEAAYRALRCRRRFEDRHSVYGIDLRRFHDGPPSASSRATSAGCGPANGFAQGEFGCVLDEDDRVARVRGWVETKDAAGPIVVRVDDSSVMTLRPPFLPRPDGHVWFEADVDLSGTTPGTPSIVEVAVSAPSGGPLLARDELLCLRRPRMVAADTGRRRSQLLGHLELPVPQSALTIGEPLWVSGWLFSTRGVVELRYAIDGREVRRSRLHGIVRPDVEAAVRPRDRRLAAYSGFIERLDTVGLAPGPRVLSVAAVQANGVHASLEEARPFVLRQP